MTLFSVIAQSCHLSIGRSVCIGAAIELLIGVVDFTNILEVTGILWNATLSFNGVFS